MNVHLITPIIWFALLITFQICRSNYNILAKVIPKSFSASHVFIFCSSSFNFMVYSTSRFLLPMRMTLHLDTLTNCLYRRFAVYPAQQVGELLTQRKSRHASGTVFDYDTRNKTLNNKAAQNRQCSTQSVSVNFLNIFFKATRNKHTQKRMFKGPIYILRAPNTGTFINYLLR